MFLDLTIIALVAVVQFGVAYGLARGALRLLLILPAQRDKAVRQPVPIRNSDKLKEVRKKSTRRAA